MAARLIARENPDRSVTWLHCSDSRTGLLIRDFLNPPRPIATEKLNEELGRHRIVPFRAVSAWIREQGGPQLRTLSATRDEEDWRWVLKTLEQRGPIDIDEPTTPEPRVVQRTRLRHFYEFLRDIPALDVHRHACKRARRANADATYLDELFGASLRELEGYDNDEAFHPARGSDTNWLVQYRDQPDKFARWVIAQAAPGHTNWLDVGGEEKVRAVAYEIYTLRTTGAAVFPDGSRVSTGGAGGLDLLLDWDGTPTVAEVKAKKDTNSFLALVQTLVYSAELSSGAQKRRLRSQYKEHFGHLSESDRLGIAIVHEGHSEPDLYGETKELAEHLMDRDTGEIAQHIGFIAFLRAVPDASDSLQVSLDRLFSSNP
jgi:hypothetical protein